MATPRLRAYRVVWISYNADPDVTKEGYLPSGPAADLAHEFLKWTMDQKIYSPVRAGMGGGGMHESCYFETDAEKVLAWWKEHGVEVEGGAPYEAWSTEEEEVEGEEG